MDKFAKKAFEEYNNEANLIRPGGVMGRNFWNINATQFIYVPSIFFPVIPAAEEYLFTATDSTGKVHTFKAKIPTAPLTPIWKDIAVGMVELKVEGIHSENGNRYISGIKTFYKAPPFPGREALPQRACSYKECAIKALKYAFYDKSSQYWLTQGKPDPDYYHNVYPSKMISSIINAMLALAEIDPQMAEDALKLASNAADYLISITYGAESPLEGIPPTYSFKGLNKEIVDATAPAADGRKNMIMMIYPASVGISYLALEKATGNKKYFEAAKRIAEYYRDNVLPNGSWYLLVSKDTKEPESNNCCVSFEILEFLNKFYKLTNDEAYGIIEKNYYDYIIKNRFETYNWEGQFEDVRLSGNFVNLTHFLPGKMIGYIADNLSDDKEMLENAKELMRFVEDQFVVWGEFAPWSQFRKDGAHWYSPAALEQYFWYVPIDSSTAAIIRDLLKLYSITKDELLLEKACALGDSVTRRQDPVTGVIPTHWMKEDCTENLENFWINCHIYTAFVMMELAKANGEI